MNKLHLQRNILLNGNITPTTAPPRWTLAHKSAEGVWSVICRSGIFTYNPKKPKSFYVERLTQEQAKERMAGINKWRTNPRIDFKPVLFAEFKRAIGAEVGFKTIDSIEDGHRMDEEQLAQTRVRHEGERRRAMRRMFLATRESNPYTETRDERSALCVC